MFVLVLDGEKMVILNLHQITTIHDFDGERATFEMCDGKTITIHGGKAVAQILGHIAHDTITLEGKPFSELIEEMFAEDAP